jgi:hypothetical protein
MNRQFCWIFIVLTFSVLLACIPADAAQSGQSGASSSPGDHGAQAGPSSGSSAGSSYDTSSSSGNPGESSVSLSDQAVSASGDDPGSGQSPDSPAEPGTAMAGSGLAWGQSGTYDENSQSGTEITGSGSPSGAGMSDVNPGVSGSQPVESPMQMQGSESGNQGSNRQDSMESQAGSTNGKSGDPARGTAPNAGSGSGSSRGSEGGNSAGSPDARGQAAGQERQDGFMISPGSTDATRFTSGTGDITTRIPGSRVPGPQRQQQGPPAQSGSYPCAPAQTSPLPPVSGQGQNDSKDDSPPRKRARRTGLLVPVIDTTVPGIPSSTQPALPLFPISLLLFGGYRRISKNNVLEHDARNIIYRAITDRPGIEVKTLSDMTGINENTLRYHSAMLASTGKITCFVRPGVVRYFRNQGLYSQFEQVVFHYLWTDTPRWILWLLSDHPGMTRQQIADALAISGPSVTRQMERLIEDGIVENRLPGRSNHYELTKDAALTLNRLMAGFTGIRHDEIAMKPLLVAAN